MITTHQPHPVTHRLKVEEMVCVECEEIIADGLTALNGVINVDSEWRKGAVIVTYDLHNTRIQDVEKLLSDIGYPPDRGFLSRKKRDWIHFTEKNEVDNLKHVGHCCSKPPVGA